MPDSATNTTPSLGTVASPTEAPTQKPRFEPKNPVNINPPKDDPITVSQLLKCNGVDSEKTYVAIKGKVYDVTGNKMYAPESTYHGMLVSLSRGSHLR